VALLCCPANGRISWISWIVVYFWPLDARWLMSSVTHVCNCPVSFCFLCRTLHSNQSGRFCDQRSAGCHLLSRWIDPFDLHGPLIVSYVIGHCSVALGLVSQIIDPVSSFLSRLLLRPFRRSLRFPPPPSHSNVPATPGLVWLQLYGEELFCFT